MRAGHVSTARVAPVIAELAVKEWPDGGHVTYLAERVGCDEGNIRRFFRQDAKQTGFTLVDNLLNALGREDVWWGELADVYAECDLRTPEERNPRYVRKPRDCGHCGTGFFTTRDAQRFCSEKCRAGAAQLRLCPPKVIAPRPCQWCEKTYQPKRSNSRFCSHRCMNQHRYHREGGAERQHERRAAA